MGITIVGLGPGNSQTITRQAWEILSIADTVYLRTERHPIVPELPDKNTYITAPSALDPMREKYLFPFVVSLICS